MSGVVPASALVECHLEDSLGVALCELKKGTKLYSKEKQAALFQTVCALPLNPLCIKNTSFKWISAGQLSLTLHFETLQRKPLSACHLKKLAVYLNAAFDKAFALFEALMSAEVTVQVSSPDNAVTRNNALKIQPATSFWRHALQGAINAGGTPLASLYDWFVLPQKYGFIEVHGLETVLNLSTCQRFDLVFIVPKTVLTEQSLLDFLPLLSSHSLFKLHCVPVINLEAVPIEPIRITSQQGEYPLYLSQQSECSECLAIHGLKSLVVCHDDGQSQTLQSLMSATDVAHSKVGCMQWRDYPSECGTQQSKLYVALNASKVPLWVNGDVWVHNEMNLSRDFRLQCDKNSSCLMFKSLAVASFFSLQPCLEQVDRSLHALSLNYRKIFQTAEGLKFFLRQTMPIRTAEHNDYIESIHCVNVVVYSLMQEGVLLAGNQLELTLNEQCVASKAMLCVWGRVLAYYYSRCLPLNTLLRLRLMTLSREDLLLWDLPRWE